MTDSSLIDWPTFWAGDPKAEDWLIEPLLPRGRQIAMYSPAKSGKSLLTLDVVARAATGRRVLDRPAGAPLRVVYFDLEMTEGDLYERLLDMGYGPDVDLSNLFYYLLPNLPPLDKTDGGDAVLSIARQHAADLLVFDTTSRVLDGPENDADTLRAFYLCTGLPLKADGRTVWRLDHAGKDLGKGQRGTSAKNDDVDLVWELLAQDNGVKLRATHRRQSWIPETLELIRLEDPLRHERAAHTWPAGTSDVAGQLDTLGAALDISQRSAGALLRKQGSKAGNHVVRAALRYRKDAAESAPKSVWRTTSEPNGAHGLAQPDSEYGAHGLAHLAHPPADTVAQRRPLVGRSAPSPTETACGVCLRCREGEPELCYAPAAVAP